ncbi:MAG: hypothetical protein AAF456_19240 [Planctomycetota bacterium]
MQQERFAAQQALVSVEQQLKAWSASQQSEVVAESELQQQPAANNPTGCTNSTNMAAQGSTSLTVRRIVFFLLTLAPDSLINIPSQDVVIFRANQIGVNPNA